MGAGCCDSTSLTKRCRSYEPTSSIPLDAGRGLRWAGFLVERVGHEKLGATSEVRRFIAGDYSPLYQCGYMMGGLQLRALRQEMVVAGKMSEKQFNDTVLTYNSMPIELIRAGMLNLPLARDTKSTWRFHDSAP